MSNQNGNSPQLFRADGTLLNIMQGANGGTIANSITSQNTGRDPSQYSIVQLPAIIPEGQLRALYRHWFFRRVVDRLPEEMTRLDWLQVKVTDGDEGAIARINKKLMSLQVRDAFRDAMKWARLFGGSAIVVSANSNQDLESPLTPETVRAIDYLTVLDRYQLYPSTGDNVLDPEFYQIAVSSKSSITNYGNGNTEQKLVRGEMVTLGQKIHKSRILRFTGDNLPTVDRSANEGWGDSVIQAQYEVFRRYYEGGGILGQILRTLSTLNISMNNLGDLIANGHGDKVKAHYQEISMMVSVFNALLTDSSIENAGYIGRSLAGAPEAVQTFRDELVAASGYPYYQIFGTVGRAGLADSGNSESEEWANRVYQEQVDSFGKQLYQLLPLVMASPDVLGTVPDDWSFEFGSVFKASTSQRLEQEKLEVEANNTRLQAGVIRPNEWRKSLVSGQPIAASIDLSQDEEQGNDGEVRQPPNGAQITAIVDVVTRVAAGEVPRDSGVAILAQALVIPLDEAEKIMGSAGNQPPPQPIATPPPVTQDSEDIRSDAIRLSGLPRDGGRVTYKGKRYIPNRPYRKGDRYNILAIKNGYVQLVDFAPSDVSEQVQDDPYSPAYWANLFFSFGVPAETKEDAVEAIAVEGELLDESEFDEIGAIDVLASLEAIVQGDDE